MKDQSKRRFMTSGMLGVTGAAMGAFAMPRGAVAATSACSDLTVSVVDFGAVPDDMGVDSTQAIQDALDFVGQAGGGCLVCPPGTYKISATLFVKYNNIHWLGLGGMKLLYTGPGYALNGLRVNGHYPQNLRLEHISFEVDAQTGCTEGVHWRFSHSLAINCDIRVRGSGIKGFVLYGDPDGTGPYYNTFLHCAVQGDATVKTGTVGWDLTFDPTFPSRCPNANVWQGGRVSQMEDGVRLRGAGNAFYSVTHEGTSRYVYHALHEVVSSGSIQNTIYSPYVEQRPTCTILRCDMNASGNRLVFPFHTGIGSVFDDQSTLQNNQILA